MGIKKVIRPNGDSAWEVRIHENGRGSKRIKRLFEKKIDAEKFIFEFKKDLEIKSLNPFKECSFENRKFKDEADDFNIDITDKQLKKYIERFDILKNSPKVQEKDLNKVSLSQLIRIVTASKGAEIEDEEEERTPDVVYQDNGITIWNGNSDENCITYGRGERWCITRGSCAVS